MSPSLPTVGIAPIGTPFGAFAFPKALSIYLYFGSVSQLMKSYSVSDLFLMVSIEVSQWSLILTSDALVLTPHIRADLTPDPNTVCLTAPLSPMNKVASSGTASAPPAIPATKASKLILASPPICTSAKAVAGS